MFAVVKSGGKQYRVKEGQELVVDRLKGEVGGLRRATCRLRSRRRWVRPRREEGQGRDPGPSAGR